MLESKKIAVVLPAFNASKTLEKVIRELPHDIIDEIILVDDNSIDDTILIAKKLGIDHILKHGRNRGYGANQKTCFNKALDLNADIIVLMHPDYQYTPKLIIAMCSIIISGTYQVVFGSRILGKGAIKGKMPIYKYFFNRLLTLCQNVIMNQKLSEFHTGFRVYSAQILKEINYNHNSDDFIFDNQIICQIFMKDYEIAEITCPTRYDKDSSSINFYRSIKYGFGCIYYASLYRLNRMKIINSQIFK
jgi:glycosyltransferase involved in cell wall biosynthesis